MGAACKGSDVRRREIPGRSNAELFVESALGDEHKAAPRAVAKSEGVGVGYGGHQVEVQNGRNVWRGTEQDRRGQGEPAVGPEVHPPLGVHVVPVVRRNASVERLVKHKEHRGREPHKPVVPTEQGAKSKARHPGTELRPLVNGICRVDDIDFTESCAVLQQAATKAKAQVTFAHVQMVGCIACKLKGGRDAHTVNRDEATDPELTVGNGAVCRKNARVGRPVEFHPLKALHGHGFPLA